MTPATIRAATRDDIPAIVRMLADDPLGASRETPDDRAPYDAAFDRILAEPQHRLVVAERDGIVVGTLQLTIVPGLSRQGANRGLVEGVRVDSSARSGGLGTQLVAWAIEAARASGCTLVQLTTDASRTDAHRFYERLGFVGSHVGFKLALDR
ncbi:GNAT family N-acetyltransferase [Sanguibacter antarcticus]|nr:GNAT family N-acetyltransferase [Sanguibacter antarcticus]